MRALPLGGAVAAVAVAVAPPAAAPASVRVTRDRVVLTTAHARAVVQRSPFRLAVGVPDGRTVLREVPPGRGAGPVALPVTDDPEPFAREDHPDHAVYAPLTFEVGRERIEQWQGSFWSGNLLRARRSGTVHRATRVVRATPAGRGVRLVLATTDGGRRLVVRLGPDRGRALRVRVRPVPARGVMTMADSFATGPGEAFHGFGGRHWGVDQRGRKLYGWTDQENFGGPMIKRLEGGLGALATTALLGRTPADLGVPAPVIDTAPGGRDHYLFPNGPGGAYYPQGLFVSSRPYGFLLNRPELSRWRLADDRPDAWQAQVSAPRLDYTVAVGAGPSAVRTLTAINGRHRLPEAWAMGPSLLRAVQNTGSETPATYAAKVQRDLTDLERLRPPLRSYAFEGWALLGDAAVRAVVARLHRLGLRALLYTRAYVAGDVLRTQPAEDFARVTREGDVATDARGRPFVFDQNGSRGVLIDPTDPGGRRWWRERVRRLLDLGADGFMDDFGEQVQLAMHFHDGSTGRTMHNRYPVLLHRLTARYQAEWARTHPRRGRPWSYTRAGWSGRPGSAATEQGTFAGDGTTDWGPGTGLQSQAPDMLNRAVGGAWGFTTDIGGYISTVTGPTTAELFTRWSQWAALTPYFRIHNSSSQETRRPWDFDAATYDRWLAMARLHERAVPYLRRLWRAALRTGMPITRPLWLGAPGDRAGAAEDQEWLLGDDVLVAPVVVQGATTRAVRLPPGCWRRSGTGARLRGPRIVTVPAPLGALPWFARCGTRPF